MTILPRLARFNTKRFNSFYLKDTLAFLSQLNDNTSFATSSSNTAEKVAWQSVGDGGQIAGGGVGQSRRSRITKEQTQN